LFVLFSFQIGEHEGYWKGEAGKVDGVRIITETTYFSIIV